MVRVEVKECKSLNDWLESTVMSKTPIDPFHVRHDWCHAHHVGGQVRFTCINAASPKMRTSLHNAQHRVIYKNAQWNCPPVWRIQDFSDDDVTWNGSIDLSFVDKQTALVGMEGRIFVKHSIVLTGVSNKFKIAANLQLIKLPPIISCFVFNQINTMVEYFINIVTNSSDLFFICIYDCP